MPLYRSDKVERMKRDPKHGLDSRWSWIVIALLSWVMLASSLSVRVMGVLYVGIVDFFGVTREEASWPLSLQISTITMGALPFGFLCHRWSCRGVLISCTFLAGAGMIVCYFAPNLNFITFFFAVVHGGAVAGIFVAVNVMSCQYFDKWQTTACCISWASQCLNVFFMPQVANYFRLEYGTPGMFLLLGALTLNGFPPTILLHSPPWLRVPRAQGETRSSKVLLAVKETGTNLTENSADHLDTEASQGEDGALVSDIQKDVSEQTQPDCHPSKILSVKPTSDLKQTLKAFLTPTFLVDTLSFAVQIYSMTTFYLVHIDLALDYGIESDHSIYFIHIYSVGDYLMRVLSGVIVDRGCMSLTTVMVLGFIGNAAGFEALAWSRSFIPFVFVTLFLGVSGGIMAALPAPVLISDFQGRSLSILLGGMLFMEGLVVMTRPSLIGFFRDNIGSYDGLVHIIAAVNGLFSIVWILKRHFQGRKAPKITAANISTTPI